MKTLLFVALLVSCGSFAQSRNEVNGWGKIKWGMSLAQVRKEYAEFKIVPETVAWPTITNGEMTLKTIIDTSKFRITHFDFDGMDVDVVVYKNPKADGVSQGALEPDLSTKASKNKNGGKNRFVRQEAFDHFRTLLIGKYGAPSNEQRVPQYLAGHEDGFERTVMWTFPSTTIKLLLREGEDPIGYVLVTYTLVRNNPM
jgi:hypothetical protein